MPEKVSNTDIWGDDLFNRKPEAEQIHAYILSVSNRPRQRQDKSNFTLAVEGGYGQGKTFFLRRFAEHLAARHPVAYCDAWADDFTDSPLTALAATLKKALGQFEDRTKIDSFLEKTGKVSRIIGKGLLRRGAGLVITDGAVAALDTLDFEVDQETQDRTEKLADGITEDSAKTDNNEKATNFMINRIADFERGKAAIGEVKASLESIVKSLNQDELDAPIIIIIDELDRCRPLYAIKVLEEIKHIFDVPGVVFILGINSEQLGHSISGLYGSRFNGHAYLKRFIDRAYTLNDAPLEKLLGALWENTALNPNVIDLPLIVIPGEQSIEASVPQFIAENMRMYGLGARDAFEVMDILQTSVGLIDHQKIIMSYFIPLAIGVVRGLQPGQLPEPVNSTRWAYLTSNWRHTGDGNPISPHLFASEIHTLLAKPADELYELSRKDGARTPEIIAARARSMSQIPPPLWSPAAYPRLLQTVSKFSNPEVQGPQE